MVRISSKIDRITSKIRFRIQIDERELFKLNFLYALDNAVFEHLPIKKTNLSEVRLTQFRSV